MDAGKPVTTPLSQLLVAFTIEFDNEFERRFAAAGGGARVASLVMWSNFMRFVGDGITVGELPAVAGLPSALVRSTIGGMERWRYVAVGPAGEPVTAKRDGYGSGRGLRTSWIVRPTPVGRTAQEIWPPLFAEIEGRWEERFGEAETDELRNALRAIAGRLDSALPEYLPIVGTANGMAVDLPPRESDAGDDASKLHLAALLSHVLVGYAIDFERESELSLSLAANFVRVLGESAMTARDLAVAAGVSDQATSMALRHLAKTGHVEVDAKLVRLTEQGLAALESSRRRHAEVERLWETRFGADAVGALRSSLAKVLEQRDALSRGLEPHPDGWRASKPYLEHTRALVDDPTGTLPHYPMVLHRGGWPDGS